jgi:hypothetical protein
MGMSITSQALARVQKSDPEKYEILKALWEHSFGTGASIKFVEAQADAAGLNGTGNADIDFVISSIKLNISSQ